MPLMQYLCHALSNNSWNCSCKPELVSWERRAVWSPLLGNIHPHPFCLALKKPNQTRNNPTKIPQQPKSDIRGVFQKISSLCS